MCVRAREGAVWREREGEGRRKRERARAVEEGEAIACVHGDFELIHRRILISPSSSPRPRAALVPFPCLSRFAHAFLWPCSSRSGDFFGFMDPRHVIFVVRGMCMSMSWCSSPPWCHGCSCEFWEEPAVRLV